MEELWCQFSYYSDKLSEGCRISYQQNNCRDPIDILNFAFEHASSTKGSSTASVVILREDYHLIIGHIGDCGIRVIRELNVVFRSEEQQVEFNKPFQLGTGSPITPSKDALRYDYVCQPGDWVLIGSDGLFDNLYEGEILNNFKKKKNKTLSPNQITMKIGDEAYSTSQSTSKTPFSESCRENGLSYRGGKMDDITVILGLVL